MPMPPKDPDYFDKVNYVIDSWTNPCDAPWYIYIETLKPAALEAFLVLISFGWGDVIRGRFRPKGLGRRTGKRKGKFLRKVPSFPEVGNLIGKGIPIAEQIDDFVLYKAGTRFLWRIDNVIQAGLFFWLVVDVTVDFAFTWTSLLYKTYWCSTSSQGSFSYHGTAESVKAGGWSWQAAYPHLDYQHPPPAWFFQTGSSGPKGCTVFAAIEFRQWVPFPAPTEVFIEIKSTVDTRYNVGFSTRAPMDDGVFRVPIKGTFPANHGFEVRYSHNAQFAIVGKGMVMAKENS